MLKIIQIDGKPHIRAQVVMLPTNQKAPITMNSAEGLFLNPMQILAKHRMGICTNQHLYFLSDEEIKEGNWFYQSTAITENQIRQYNGKYLLTDTCKKIIATTDESLNCSCGENQSNVLCGCLPKPSQSFLEKYVEAYNKGKQIKEVMIEFEETGKIINTTFPASVKSRLELKINPKDNTITIRPVKDNWNKGEVVVSVLKMQHDYAYYLKSHKDEPNSREIAEWTNDWIEQNL